MIDKDFIGEWAEVTLRSGRQLDGMVREVNTKHVRLWKRNYRDQQFADSVSHLIKLEEIVAVTYTE